MFHHIFLLIFRNIKRNKTSFFINLIGLSTGLASALLIYLWVNDEFNVDKFFENDSQLYQVMQNQHNTECIVTTNETPGLLARSLAEEMPEIEYAACGTDPSWGGNCSLSVKGKSSKARGAFVSQDYFNVFPFDFIQGDKNQVLSDKNSIVISQSLAIKLFNTTENVVGKIVKWQLVMFENNFVISGVYKDVPPNSSQQFDFVLSFNFYEDLGGASSWDNFTVLTYVILKQGTNVNQLNNKIGDFVKNKQKGSNVTLFLKRYSEKYLYGKYENGELVGGRIDYVRLFSIIAIFILVIACINFMNLSTARASKRVKEIGIKKTIGVKRGKLIFQYLGESMFMTFLSLIIAIILSLFLLPKFNEITGKHVTLDFNANIILSVLGITLVTGLISGSYPALYLSSFNPVTVLKGKFNNSIVELWVRKGLVIFQFILSVIFIVSVLVVYKQIEFIQTKKLGYDKDNIIYFDKDGKFLDAQNLEIFLSEVKNIPGVINASSISSNLVKAGGYTMGITWEGKDPNKLIRYEKIAGNYDIIETLGIEMKEGRTFSRNFGSDNSAIIFNEAAIKAMGINNPVGKSVNLWGENKQIIGVTKDFHFESFHENVKPLFFIIQPWTSLIMVKITTGMERETIMNLQKVYEKFNPDFSFEYKFQDECYHAEYAAEKRVAVLSKYFTGIAIIISCLGLFGLAVFTSERRRKEICIRKVHGSTNLGIVQVLFGDFTKQVLASIIIALPTSYLIVRHWLDSFVYKIDLQLWYFLVSGVIALFIAWFTVGMQAIKGANINPSQGLRDE